ncbi:alpha/beta hydrolase [Arenibacter sp. 6A1]|uniref:alpha/beta hydrolase n=1 Tax=Arenibacter sp. 6A1 TaxID=2720391 RepID=UPI001447FD98|nr:alpha/beta hydrolase [Arenibacter sp. 6A1]NKI28464.1 alpha/beta hydrolase [Arenibacter sp. 6A1]
MNRKRIIKLGSFTLLLLICSSVNAQITELRNWLNLDPKSRPQLETLSFSKEGLSENDAQIVRNLLIEDKQLKILETYNAQWDNRLLEYGSYKMPFYYKKFGEEPSDGRSLFISLHGGGGTMAAVNDQQYTNQQNLYDTTMNSLEGIYLAPRAPTNTWNLWHQTHIDEFLNIIIQLAVIKENVNPNKVYILGFSAGGDGLYQLAPRMADRWAAASMMAGHPNDASPLGLRNTPFAIHVGALDTAYERSDIAKQWGTILDDLQANDPQGYIHDVQIHAGLGHWMNLQDAVSLPWMADFRRNPIPKKVMWLQDDRHHTSFYWLQVPENLTTTGGKILAEYNSSSNEINVIENYSDTLNLLINDNMLNLDKPITIKYQNTEIYKGFFHRSILNIYKNLMDKGDANLAFPCVITMVNNQTITEENIKIPSK